MSPNKSAALRAAAQRLVDWMGVVLTALTVLLATPHRGHAQSVHAGRLKATTCLTCHGVVGYEIGYPDTYRVPKLAGQSASYLVAALTAYQQGDRKHPAMRIIANRLSAADMEDLALYFERDKGQEQVMLASPSVLPNVSPAALAPEVSRLLQRGSCAACHGESFGQPMEPKAPKLAGQHADYLLAAMTSYGQNGFFVGRSHHTMSEHMRRFSPQELSLLARYLSGLEPSVKTLSASTEGGR